MCWRAGRPPPGRSRRLVRSAPLISTQHPHTKNNKAIGQFSICVEAAFLECCPLRPGVRYVVGWLGVGWWAGCVRNKERPVWQLTVTPPPRRSPMFWCCCACAAAAAESCSAPAKPAGAVSGELSLNTVFSVELPAAASRPRDSARHQCAPAQHCGPLRNSPAPRTQLTTCCPARATLRAVKVARQQQCTRGAD